MLTFFALRFFPRIGLLDKPKKYGLARPSIPYFGGLVIYLVFLIATAIFLSFDLRLLGVIIAATFIVGVSFLDDYFEISPFIRLYVQIFAALILFFFGVHISEIRNPFDGVFQLSTVLGIGFTIFWVILIMNTVNFLDGLNGLASGVSGIGFFILFVLSIRPAYHTIDQSAFAVLSLIMAIASLTFMLFEFAPAKILMGDTGSMFLGFMLATMGIFAGGKIATAFLVLGFPILDAFWVVLRRLYYRKSPFKGDLKHLHHRLIRAGLTERQALLCIYLISASFGAIALFLETFEKIVALFVLIGFLIIIAFFLFWHEKRRNSEGVH